MNIQIDRLGKVSITVEKDYWDDTKCYDKLVIVEKENDCAYLSRKPVPAGISVADREYWIKIGFNTSGGGINVTTTFNPSNVNINETTTIQISVTVDSDADTIKVKKGSTLIGSGSGSTFTCTDTVSPTTTDSIKYEVEVTVGNKVVTKSYSVSVNAADAGISWPNSTNSVYIDDTTFQQLTNPHSLLITYSSSNQNVATINSSTGAITLHAKGTTTIKAAFAGNSSYSPKEVSYQLTVRKHNAGLEWRLNGTQVSEYNVNLTDEFTYPSVYNPNGLTGISYSSSNNNIATVGNSGIPTLLQEGDVNVVATFAENELYEASTIQYKLIIAGIPDKLVYSYIPITNTQANDIIDGNLTINSLLNNTDIETNAETTEGYILDDNNQSSHEDEIIITSPTSGYFIQIFLLSNINHKVINYLVFGGIESKSDIETQRYANDVQSTLYTTNNYEYDNENYKIIAILRRGQNNNLILIQEIQ